MVTAQFFRDGSKLVGFHIFGHAEYEESGKDIVCAAVSSSAYMVANTITDIMNIKAQAEAGDGDMYLMIPQVKADLCQDMLRGLELHMRGLAEQYKDNLQVIITEV